jgi:hypothetical protein
VNKVHLAWWARNILIAAIVGLFFWWALDRREPFRLLDYTSTKAKPGEVMRIDGKVWRSAGRGCSLVGSRLLYDSLGTRYQVMDTQYITANSLDAMEKITPGEMHVTITVPADAKPGPAILFTLLSYRCNPLHSAWPVDMLLTMNVEIAK